jgi:oxygen-dependent protoporphyrinogen oxidase
MLGGSYFEEQFGDPSEASKDHIKNEALIALQKALDIQGEPSKVCVSIHRECIPQYTVGHSDLIQSMREYVAQHNLPLTLAGSWYDGVGLNDCVYHTQIAVDKIFNE